MLLSNGTTLSRRACASTGRRGAIGSATTPDRPSVFRYVETPDGTFVVNSAHIVELQGDALR